MPISQSAFGVTKNRVTAVVVSIGSDASVLSRAVAALATQTTLPQRVLLAVPTAAHAQEVTADPAICAAFGSRLYVIPVGDMPNFGSAVSAALRRYYEEVAKKLENDDDASPEWIWLLHADCAPAPNALQELLERGNTSAKIAIVGPKQVAPRTHASDPCVLLEMGINATRSARRVPELREGERDQGQYDSREDVLGVGSAGMLVRERVWTHLGGFNPNLGPFGDGLEFSRRAWLAGYRVVAAPRAIVEHGSRSLLHGGDNAQSFGMRRYAQVYNALLAAKTALVIPLWIGYILGALPRALVRLMWRDSVRAQGELTAGLQILGAASAIFAGRREIARLGGDMRVLASLEASAKEVRSAKKAQHIAALDEAASAQIDPIEHKAQRDLRQRTRRGFGATLLISALFAAVLNIPYFSQGTLIGGALATDKSTAADIWNAAAHSWLLTGDGYSGTIDAYWLFYMPFLAFGAPWGITLGQAVTAALYAAIPCAAIWAYLAAGRYTKSAALRTAMALLWMISPSFLEALAQGRIAAVTVHIVLPLALFALVGAWRRTANSDTYDDGAQIGILSLACALLASAAPIYALCALLIAITGWIGRPAARKRWLWVPIPALVMLIPAFRSLGLSWRAWISFLFAQPGVPFSSPTQARSILSGFVSHEFTLTSAQANWLLFIPTLVIVFVAVAALGCLRVAPTVRLAWLVIALGMALALTASRIPVGISTGSALIQPAAAWYGVGFSLAWLGVWIAIVAGANEMRTSLRRASFSPLTILCALLAVCVPLSMLSVSTFWVYSTWKAENRAIYGEPEVQAPAIAHSHEESPARSRVLAINPTANGYDVEIWRGDGVAMHEYTMAREARKASRVYPLSSHGVRADSDAARDFDSAEADMARALADISAAGTDVSRILAEHAISIVLVPPAHEDTDSQAQAQLIGYLNAVPGLEFITSNEAGSFWRVPLASINGQAAPDNVAVDAPARLRIVDPTNDASYSLDSKQIGASAPIRAAGAVRYLVLAERADNHWNAEVSGRKLTPLSEQEIANLDLPSWAQIWELPAGVGGNLTLSYSQWLHLSLFAAQILAIVIGIFVAAPLHLRKEDVA